MTYGQQGVEPSLLQSLGKQASSRHLGRGVNMTDAVVDVLRDHGAGDLSDDHVRRVVEFANNAAFTTLRKQASGDHMLINFDGGPADPVEVLRTLRSQDGTEVIMKAAHDKMFVHGLESYELYHGDDMLPGREKTASAINPSKEYADYSNLRAAVAEAEHRLEKHAQRYEGAVETLCKEARELLRSGVSTSEIAGAVDQISPHETFTQLGLRHLSDRLSDMEGTSMTKTAGVVVKEHPFREAFEEMVKVAIDFYSMAAATEKLRSALNKADEVIREIIQ